MKRRKNGGERMCFSFSKLVIFFISAGILLISNAFAETVVLDFEQLATPGTGHAQIASYFEDGFSLVPGDVRDIFYWRSDDENFAGSTALYTFSGLGPPSYTKITREDGLSFELDSIMLCEE